MASKAETFEALNDLVDRGHIAGVLLDNWPDLDQDDTRFIVYIHPYESWSFTHKEAEAFLVGFYT